MLRLVSHARIDVDRFGGLTKRGVFSWVSLYHPREETEWLETIHAGGNILAGVEPDKICDAVSTWESSSFGRKGRFFSGGS